MLILIAVWIGMFWGAIKWLATIAGMVRNRCQDKDCRLGAIVSNICYIIVIGFFVLLTKDASLFITVYPILLLLGNTVFCMCTNEVPEYTEHDDDVGNDDYGYIKH